MKRRNSAIAAGAIVAASIGAAAGAAHAYELVYGSGISCFGGRDAGIQGYTYGDWNAYSNYGLEDFEYSIPFNQQSYVYVVTSHSSVTSTALEAENYVDGPVTPFCWP